MGLLQRNFSLRLVFSKPCLKAGLTFRKLRLEHGALLFHCRFLLRLECCQLLLALGFLKPECLIELLRLLFGLQFALHLRHFGVGLWFRRDRVALFVLGRLGEVFVDIAQASVGNEPLGGVEHVLFGYDA